MRLKAAGNSSTVPPAPSKSRAWAHWITLVLLFVTCVVVRLVCLACKPFWFDEAFSVEVARINWPNFLNLLWWREANMSLYYMVLRGWLHGAVGVGDARDERVLAGCGSGPVVREQLPRIGARRLGRTEAGFRS